MNKLDSMQGELKLSDLLHECGYTFLTIPKLTYKETKQIIDGYSLRRLGDKGTVIEEIKR